MAAVSKISVVLSVAEAVNSLYTKEALQGFYRAFLRNFILDNKDLCRRYEVPVEDTKKTTPNKTELVNAILPFFKYGELFRKMLSALPAPMPAIVEKIIWEGMQEHEDLEREFAIKIAYTNQELDKSYPSALDELNPLFYLFRDDYTNRSDYYTWSSTGQKKNTTTYRHAFSFPPVLQEQLQNFLEKPIGFNLLPIHQPELPAHVYADAEGVFSELPVALSYLQEDKLAIAESGNIGVSSFVKMRKYCSLKEFYSDDTDKYAASIRSRFIAEMLLAQGRQNFTSYTDPLAFLKQAFILYQQGRWSSFTVLFHLKGLQKAKEQEGVNRHLFSLLRELPLMEWVSAENLLQNVLYRNVPVQLVRESDAYNYLYFESESRYGKNKNYTTKAQYRSLIIEPLIRGSFFLYATFGLVDIAFDLPNNPKAEKFNKKFISVFDGLKYVRLTPLGAYLCGLSKEYQVTVTPDHQILLDEQNLFIIYQGDNKPLLSILNKVARQAGEHLYKVDYETLLADCQTQKEVEGKINIFKQLISANPPPNWQHFFDTLKQKSFVLDSLENEFKLFQLPDNKELIRLVASDEFLKKSIIKGEMYFIIIPKSDITKVKNYLKKFGFLIDFS